MWAGMVEYLPPVGKAIGGAAVSTIGAIGAVKLWRDKRRERDQREESSS